MKELFSQKDVEGLAKNVYKKIVKDLDHHFYNELEPYLYEHYDNAESEIKENLILQISGEFTRNPTDYNFRNLRDQIFQENKEELTSVLTEDAIQTSVDKIINDYTHIDHPFHWEYKEGITNFITNNKDLFVADAWVQKTILRKLRYKDTIIHNLEQEIRKLKDEV